MSGAYLLITPSFLFIIIFLFALWTLFVFSFRESLGMGQIKPGFTFLQYARFFKDPHYLGYLTKSLWLTTLSTLICILFGYPTAYVMVRKGKWFRQLITIFLVINLFSMYVVRVYSLMVVLGNNGIIVRSLNFLDVIQTPIKLMYNEIGVIIGLFIGSVPFMVFPICSALDNVTEDQVEAALSLGANRIKTFFAVTFPLSLPGVASGILLSFSWSLSSYVAPALLGGGFSEMMANFIYDQAIGLLNFPMASASAFILLFITIFIIFLINKVFGHFIRGIVVK